VRILFIGGTRSVGSSAARRLARNGHEVTVFHRGEHESDLPASVRHLRSPAAAMPVRLIPPELIAFEPEVVVHMIAMGEQDMRAAVNAFAGVARRLVVPSSGDVYRAFGVFKGLEPDVADPALLDERAPLRRKLFPYRAGNTPTDALAYYYEKILVERTAQSDARLAATILRFPKLYGPKDNADLATVYGFRHHPHWRWTHGHVENVAAAVALAVEDNRAAGRTFNVGEKHTPTMGERLARLPPADWVPLADGGANFEQPIAYDTSRIRSELGYRDEVDEAEAMLAVAEAAAVRAL
jgi:nucleoside-diphosphate-sugar epimerase